MDQDENLWDKIKTAKSHLFTQTNILERYGSTSMNVPNKSHPFDRTGPSENHNKAAAVKDLGIPSVVVTGPSPSPAELPRHGLSAETLPQGKQADQGDTPHSCSRGTQTSKSLPGAEGSPDEETSSKATSPSTVVPGALPVCSQQDPQDISEKGSLGNNGLDSVNAEHFAASQEAASCSVNKSGTNSSDEVILRNGRFGASNGQRGVGTQSCETFDQGAGSIQRDGSSSSRQGRTDSRPNALDPEKLGLQDVGMSPRRAFENHGLCQGKLSTAKKGPAKGVPMSPEEELKMLRKKILLNAHMNRFRDLGMTVINQSVLDKARDGPGTDPTSVVYREFMKRATPQGASSSSMSSARAQSASGQPKASHEGTWIDLHAASRVPYSESPAIYPAVENGQMVLLPEPTPGVQQLIKVIGQEFGLVIGSEVLRQADQATENNWDGPFYANWEFCPSACSNFPASRDGFRRWLDDIVQICSHTDIYHQAFFDGTAHSDGMRSFELSDLDVPTTRLDLSDKETRLHSHETVEGYCHNWAVHIKREEERKNAQQAIARTAYFKNTKDKLIVIPRSSRPSYVLRSVELDDIPELLVIMNRFIKNSTLAVNVSPLEAEHVRERIETAKREKLPFLVVAERRRMQSRDYQSNGLLGYAFATDTAGDRTASHFTAELEVFVLEEHRQHGIGKCLFDKLVEICDPTFFIKGGYYIDSNRENRPGYGADGRRRISHLLVIISVPNDEHEQYKWLREWLERDYEFEQQGLLKGTHVKFNRFLSSSYMVRSVGCVDEDTFGN